MEGIMIRLFEIFREVVISGSISSAAKSLRISQPAISVAIRDLEAHYHCQLFARIGKRLVISEQGIWLYGQIIEILDNLQHIEEQLQNKEIKKRIRLGASLSVGSTVLAQYVKEFGQEYPFWDIRILVEHNETVEQRLIRNECDLALIEGICDDDRIESLPFFHESLVCIASLDFPYSEITIDQLSTFDFLAREKGSGTRMYVDTIMSANGISLKVKWQSQSIEALLLAVEAGLGISILPQSVVERSIDSFKCKTVSIKGMSLKRVVSLAFRRERKEDDLIDQWQKFLIKK
jgi:DNA-binding transcriptional LysR family regulator